MFFIDPVNEEVFVYTNISPDIVLKYNVNILVLKIPEQLDD